MYVIGFGGIAGSGKSTAADYVEIESLNHDCKPIRLSFADPVRAQAAKQAGYDDWRIFKHEKPDLYRELCQLVADEGRPSTWVNLLNEKLKQIQAEELSDSNLLFEERLVIIDDLRYSNEIELVKAWQGLTVYVSPGNRIVADADGAWRAHESEWLNQRIEGGVIEIENYYEWVVFNSGDPMAFEKKLHDRLQFFIGCSPSRFADECNCPACLGFRVDIQGLKKQLKTFVNLTCRKKLSMRLLRYTAITLMVLRPVAIHRWTSLVRMSIRMRRMIYEEAINCYLRW